MIAMAAITGRIALVSLAAASSGDGAALGATVGDAAAEALASADGDGVAADATVNVSLPRST